MTDGTTKPVIRALLKAAAASLLSLWAAAPLFVPALSAGEAVDALNQIAAPAEPPAVPVVDPPAEPAALVSAVRPLKVYFLNIGQGDAEYIELPNGKNVLIDGGPSKSSHSLLAQFMTMQNVTKIDYVVLTHPHSDHYKGLYWVFNNFSVGRFYDTKMDNTTSKTDNLLRDQINTRGVSVTYPAAGDTLDWDPAVQVRVFNSCPEPVQSDDGNNINNCSIAVKMSYQGSSALFTGDMEATVESVLIGKFGKELQSDVLKVAHHGSKTATSVPFLAAVKPAAAYISVGKNSYDLPNQDVVDRLKASGIKVRRTDEVGTQEVVFGAPAAAASGAEAGELAAAR